MTGVALGPLGAACAAIGYALALWLLASGVALRRGLHLGRLPATALFASAVAPFASIAAGCSPAQIALTSAAIVGALICASVDARTGLIFDALTATSAAVVLLCALAAGEGVAGVIGAAVVGGTLLVLHLGTRRRGLGLGDVKLGALIGLGFGAGGGMLALAIAFVIGGVYGTLLLLRRRATRGDAVRFGPFLAGGTMCASLCAVAGVFR